MAGQSLNQLVDSITVDAYGADEQLTAFFTVFGEEVSLPCAALPVNNLPPRNN